MKSLTFGLGLSCYYYYYYYYYCYYYYYYFMAWNSFGLVLPSLAQ